MSARTALERPGTEPGYYSEIASFTQSHSILPEEDLRELWQRMAFTILVRNTDDHLKNHAFVHVRDGKWRLSPMFDVNPQPGRAPKLETGIAPEFGFEPDIRAAISAAPLFLIEEEDAARVALRMARIVSSGWRKALQAQGVTGGDIRRYAAAFEHDQMEAALTLASRARPVDDDLDMSR